MNILQRIFKPRDRTKQRLLFVTRELVPFHYGGIGTHFKALAQCLTAQGHRVRFLSSRPENFEQRMYHKHYGQIQVEFVPTEGIAGPGYNFRYAWRVKEAYDRLQKEFQPDIVFCAEYGGEGLFLLMQAQKGDYPNSRFVITTQGGLHEAIEVYEGRNPEQKKSAHNRSENQLTIAMENLSLVLAKEIVAPTQVAWQEVRQRLDLSQMAHIIPNFASQHFLDSRTVAPTEKKNRMILFVGRLDRHKGADILLEAYLTLAKTVSDPGQLPNLVFVGRDCMFREYQTTFLKYWESRIPEKLIRKIIFAGQIAHHQVQDYFKQALVCVFPSRWEVFGIVCLEAMAGSCPVLVSKGTGLEELLGSKLNEWAIDVHNSPKVLVERLGDILSEPDHRRRYGRLFYKRAHVISRKGISAIRSLIENPVRNTTIHSKSTAQAEQLYTSLLMATASEFDREHN